MQIEYALQAVAAGAPSVGIKGGLSLSLSLSEPAVLTHTARNGVVIATEKKQKSVLYDESSISKVTWEWENWSMSV